MPYNKGNFYHESGKQVIDNVVLDNAEIKNAQLDDCEMESLLVGGVKIFQSATAPTAETLAPAGSLCICTAADGIGLYINKGTDAVPSWKAATFAV